MIPSVIYNKKDFFKASLEKGCKVMEVTVKQYYVTYPNEKMTEQHIKQQWFGEEKLNSSHAYRDGSHIGGADELVDIKFISNETLDEVPVEVTPVDSVEPVAKLFKTTWVENKKCPECGSENIGWYLSSTKQCKECKNIFRAEVLI